MKQQTNKPQALTVKQFRSMISRAPKQPQYLLITSELAYEALTFHHETLSGDGVRHQRPLRAARSEEYQRRMQEGLWKETAQPLQFDVAGRLLDGQHRCDAIFQAEACLPMWVFFGRPEADFEVTDIGTPRNSGDIFAIQGVPSAKNAAAVTRAVATLRQPAGYSKGGGGGNVRNVSTPAEAYRYYLELGAEAVQYGVSVMAKFSASGLPSPSVAGGVAVLVREKIGQDGAAKFFDAVALGADLGARSVEKRLRDHMLREGKSMNRDEVCYTIIAAWNARHLRRRSFAIWKYGDPKPALEQVP